MIQSMVVTGALGLILCGLYPLAVTTTAQLIFPDQANGSLIRNRQGQVVGSALIGQNFSKPEYFWPRPSAAGEKGYDPLNSGGSNLGPTSQKLKDRIEGDIKRLQTGTRPIPADLVMASGSGLDPHISIPAAEFQVERIAAARKIPIEEIEKIIQSKKENRELGFLGEPRVNVLKLNLALDGLKR